MKIRKTLLATAVLLLAALSGAWAQKASSWPWPDSMDALTAAPGNHQKLYEDENIRILSVTVRPGETEKSHDHKYPSVLIFDSFPNLINRSWDGQTLSRQRLTESDPYPVVVSMQPQEPHAVENVDTIPMHLYRVEFKKLQFRNITVTGAGAYRKSEQ